MRSKFRAPFEALPPSGYVDANGDIYIRIPDDPTVESERHRALALDCRAGKVGITAESVPDPINPLSPSASDAQCQTSDGGRIERALRASASLLPVRCV